MRQCPRENIRTGEFSREKQQKILFRGEKSKFKKERGVLNKTVEFITDPVQLRRDGEKSRQRAQLKEEGGAARPSKKSTAGKLRVHVKSDLTESLKKSEGCGRGGLWMVA